MRTPMVTRTFHTTKVNALFVNVETKETFEKSFVLSQPFKSEREITKAIVKANMFAGSEKLVTILGFENINTKYAMSEQTFIENATQITENTID